MRLEGKVAIVTGASSGIGQAVARLFAQEGAKVALVGRRLEALREVASQIEAEGGVALPIQADVRLWEDVERAVREALDAFGSLQILINNAGLTRDNLAVRMTEEEWDEVMEVNLRGTFLFCKAVFRPMRRQRYGKIVNTSSVVVRGNMGQANYAASKAGVIALTRTLALEFARAGIRVNCVAPGFIETPMTAGLPETVREEALKRIPLGRFGKPEEVAQLHLFLASPESDYITGQIFFIDGGATVGL
ncbi:MAG: 3-oxoacyl-[acyl-carrier-protein] reductase [Deltaproteobacteria bacterium]|nr:MAG: 3-oxoacyl-[acyl-carrier-protein] reductase [Deltaproteobacteria bacterium]HEX16353.1 3-oxoacyl-[acyl-carrier-protein] reductase [Deltaproteobacteria bacterium]